MKCAFGNGREKYNKIKWGLKWYYSGGEEIKEEGGRIDAERCNEEYDINDMRKHSEKWCLRLLDTLDEITNKEKIIKEQEQKIINKDKTIKEQEQKVKEKDEENQKLKEEIKKFNEQGITIKNEEMKTGDEAIKTKDEIIKSQLQEIKTKDEIIKKLKEMQVKDKQTIDLFPNHSEWWRLNPNGLSLFSDDGKKVIPPSSSVSSTFVFYCC
jgi:hypothetical protein